MMYIDTHTHLHFEDFDSDRAEVIGRAGKAGVSQIITLGTDLASSRKAVQLSGQYPGIFAATGVHPSEAHLISSGEVDQIKSHALKESGVVAIGEIGLDFYWDKTHHRAQYDNFRNMLNLAKEINLPVVIHNRAAHREMEWFFQEEKFYELSGVMHCFSGQVIDARFYLDMGLLISFTANITYENFQREDVLKFVPLDRVLLETDSPYIAPAGFNKKRNEPANVVRVAEKLAQIHGTSPEEMGRITTQNARRLFRLPDIYLTAPEYK